MIQLKKTSPYRLARKRRDLTELSVAHKKLPDPCLLVDGEWRLTFVNEQAELMMMRKKDELLNRLLWNEFEHPVGALIEKHLRRAVAEDSPVTFETFYKPWEKWIEFRAYPGHEELAVFWSDLTPWKIVTSQTEVER